MSMRYLLFNELALLDKKIDSKAISVGDLFCLAADLKGFNLIYPYEEGSTTRLNLLKSFYFLKLTQFSFLPEHIKTRLAHSMHAEELVEDVMLFSETVPHNSAFIIAEGEVIYGSQIKKPGEFMEELALYDDHIPEVDATTATKATIFVLSKRDVEKILSPLLISYFKTYYKMRNFKVPDLSQLKFIKYLGKGTFGEVIKVHDDNKIYALKRVNKRRIRAVEEFEMLKSERNILFEVNHPFALSLICTFNASNNLYFLMEMVKGDLFEKKLNGSLEESAFKFYIGSLFLVHSYLSERSIAHRDIKPQNVIVSPTGYIKLIDFGAAVKIKGVAKTLVGTQHYMAPEVIRADQGYDCSCDAWSIGVIAYQMAYGCFPFGGDESSPFNTYKAIQEECCFKQEAVFPQEDRAEVRRILLCYFRQGSFGKNKSFEGN